MHPNGRRTWGVVLDVLPEGEGFVRLCFATDPARLSEALDRIEPLLR
jgi:bifunctional pyridoxal-dependent enzyme with beta-cystathionase and maltose regulon repressor activities